MNTRNSKTRMAHAIGLLSILAISMPAFSEVNVLTLEHVLARAQASVDVGLAESQWEVAKADNAASQAREGPSWVLGTGIASSTEPITDETTRSYLRGSVRAGIRYPLLGAAQRQRADLKQTEQRAILNELNVGTTKQQFLHNLVKQYVTYWSASEKIALTERFLSRETEFSGQAKERTMVGFLLQSDRIEYMSQFDVARRDLGRLRVQKNLSLRELNNAGLNASEAFTAILPESTGRCENGHVANTDAPPTRVTLTDSLNEKDSQNGIGPTRWFQGVDADVRLETNLSQDYPSLQWGGGVGISLNFSAPWDIRGAARAEQTRVRESQRQLSLLFRQRMEAEERESQAMTQRAVVADLGLQFAAQRTRAAMEALRLAALRAQHLEGDVLERLQIRRYDYYRAASDYIDARAEYAEAQRTLAEQGKPNCQSVEPSRASVTTPGKAKSPNLGAYVWHTPELRQMEKEKPAMTSKLAQAGVERVLISLDAAQLANLHNEQARDSFKQFLWNAQKAGLRIELLLGDPSWILPAHRQNLLDIVRDLRDFPFIGLHLDLEPEQLENWEVNSSFYLAELAHTLQSVAEISPWPLALSAHPRWFEATNHSNCFACLLPSLGVNEITLMVYVADTDKVVARVRPIVQANPTLQFSLAQSVETQLGEESSFATRGKIAFHSHIERLKVQLAAPNFTSVFIQDWQAYQRMSP